MSTNRLYRPLIAVAAVGLVAGPCVTTALANPITSTSVAAGWLTTRKISGNIGAANVGETVTVTYPPGTVPPSQSATVNAVGGWTIFPPATVPANTPVTITSTAPGCPGPTPAVVAQLLDPPNNTAFAVHTILPGSTAVLAGNTFTLAGGYTLTATDIDYDSSSPTFGDLSGEVLASEFDVTGSGALGTFSLELSDDQPYMVSMLPIFPPNDPIGGSITFNIPLAGTVVFNSMTSPFSGFATGTATYGENGAETYNYTFEFDSDFGTITGAVSSFGTAQLVPEPGSAMLFGLGALGLVGYARRRTRARSTPVTTE